MACGSWAPLEPMCVNLGRRRAKYELQPSASFGLYAQFQLDIIPSFLNLVTKHFLKNFIDWF